MGSSFLSNISGPNISPARSFLLQKIRQKVKVRAIINEVKKQKCKRESTKPVFLNKHSNSPFPHPRELMKEKKKSINPNFSKGTS